MKMRSIIEKSIIILIAITILVYAYDFPADPLGKFLLFSFMGIGVGALFRKPSSLIKKKPSNLTLTVFLIVFLILGGMVIWNSLFSNLHQSAVNSVLFCLFIVATLIFIVLNLYIHIRAKN